MLSLNAVIPLLLCDWPTSLTMFVQMNEPSIACFIRLLQWRFPCRSTVNDILYIGQATRFSQYSKLENCFFSQDIQWPICRRARQLSKPVLDLSLTCLMPCYRYVRNFVTLFNLNLSHVHCIVHAYEHWVAYLAIRELCLLVLLKYTVIWLNRGCENKFFHKFVYACDNRVTKISGAFEFRVYHWRD